MGAPPGRVAAWSWGSGARTLVFLHALLPASSGRSIAEAALRLVDRLPVRVVGVDAPGFGESEPLPADDYDLDRLARRLEAAARELAQGPYAVMGHSWGAALAVRVAALDPSYVEGVVLIDGGHFDHADLLPPDDTSDVDATVDEMERLGWRHRDESLEAILDLYTPLDRAPRPLWAHVVRAGLMPEGSRGHWQSRVQPSTAGAAMHALMRSRASSHYPALAAAATPVLLLTATEPEQRRRENAERAATLRDQLPGLDWRPLAACRHDVFLDAPVRAADEIADWWTRRVRGRRR